MTAYQLKNIAFSYNKVPVLLIKSLDIYANKITALIGPNGCGKSTLLNLLAFLLKSQQGQMSFFSEPVSNPHQHKLIKRIAFLPQKPYMLRGSVADNLSKPLQFHHLNRNQTKRIQMALEQIGIAHLSQQQAKALSGGEQQKVALARAIITNPDVLLMDEPFNYLDYGSEQRLESFIKDYVKDQNKTVIFSTHNRLQGISIASEVISLLQGSIVNSPLINLFHGSMNDQLFDTGKIKIMLTDNRQNYQYASINPNEIVLSTIALVSSMQNQYQGKIIAIADEAGKIRVTVAAGEVFQVMITLHALKELNISLGAQTWISFKSSSISMH